MSKRGLALLLTFCCILIHQFANQPSPIDGIKRLFIESDSLLNLPELNETNSEKSLKGFDRVISQIEKNPFPGSDSLLFLSYRNKGVLLEIAADYHAANIAYANATHVRDFDNTPFDSLLVMTYINMGSCYYYLNNFDSANYFLQRSDSIIDRFPDIEYKVRLYNTLGVLYHDNGNYNQCKNYFSQALDIIKSKQPLDSISAASVEINIATSYLRLEQYQESINIYKRLLKYNLFNSHIYINMGKAYVALEQYENALDCFQKVNAKQLPWVYNDIGYTYLKMHKHDSAKRFLDHVQQSPDVAKINIADIGINKLYSGEWHAQQHEYLPALDSLQRAIMIFGNINNSDIYFNPKQFTGSFAYYRLFTALSKKASVFYSLFLQSNQEKYLLASHETYKSTLSLLSYIEKSFDTDDAKLFLKKRIQTVYQQALNVCLSLYLLHPDKNYKEEAFLISEKNKASVVISNLNERTSIKVAGVGEEVLQKERNLKYNIARLTVRSDQAIDITSAKAIAKEKEPYEIELARLQKSLEKNSHVYKLKYDDAYPSVEDLKTQVGKNRAMISFYFGDSILNAFVVTGNSFEYVRIDSITDLKRDIVEWIRMLRNTESGRKFSSETLSKRIYQKLIRPLQIASGKADEWIIIPDGLLYYLPFESLWANDEGTLLVETTTISYQFASRFINNDFFSATQSTSSPEVLAFAPFNIKSAVYNDADTLAMEKLAASEKEINTLSGKKYFDTAATKIKFLTEINRYPVVHLATHAVADDTESSKSFIAFYPQSKSLIKDCLFLDEIYSLNMDSTELMIISACETGKGELINNEGVLSLSRAFIYAGCKSTINSLWKADDQATAQILNQFYVYLKKGLSKAKALQQAKLDYINSEKMVKGSAFWSHLVIVGNTEPLYMSRSLLWTIIAGLIVLLAIFFIWKKKKSRRFS